MDVMKSLGQIACEAISGPDGWAGCADVPGLQAMWESAAQAVADKAAAEERERCAVTVETCEWPGWAEPTDARDVYAAAIRARGVGAPA
jgi:hypothetical protein